jgi:uncharacterized protein YndB with AHSA1/START domain
MKKIAIALLGLVLVGLLLGYLLLPSDTKIVFTYNLPVPARMANRALFEKDKWQQWWKAEPSMVYDQTNFSDAALFANTYRFVVRQEGGDVPGTIRVMETGKAECSVVWSAERKKAPSFWDRLQNFFSTNTTSKVIQQQAASFSAFASKVNAVYGMEIREQQVTDTILVSTRKTFDHNPTVAEVYQLVEAIQNFITEKGAVATNHPMLHVDSMMRGEYQTMVGLPVNKDINAKPPFVVKRMVPGKILVADIKGGLKRVQQACLEMQHYAEDHQRVAPAIPFEMMVTNRMQEKDSSKWVTKIYYPVF